MPSSILPSGPGFGDDLFPNARVLIVDDDAASRRVLERLLRRAGCERVEAAGDVFAALDLWGATPPDIALVDLHMPGASGFDLLERIREGRYDTQFIPVIMLTGDASQEVRRKALDLGAHDFLTKPFDATEVLLRIRNHLRTRVLNLRLREANEFLEERVRERTQSLEEARREALDHLARAAEFRDDATGQHTKRVGDLSAALAAELGWPQDQVELIRSAAPLHDIGKIGIPDAILSKAGPLTPEEYAVMKTHTSMGAAILAGSRSPVFIMAQEIALTHHERWDGMGYPNGLAGEAIALTGRIVSVADVFDALTNERPYKLAIEPAAALAEIEADAGKHFDPEVVAALKRVLKVQHARAMPS